MASLSPFQLSSLMILIILMVSLFVSSTCSTKKAVEDGFRINIRHVDSNGNYSKLELLQRGMERGKHRLARLVSSLATSSDNSVQTPVHAGQAEFLMDIAIGTPLTSYSAIMDTGSDLIWTQCKPCVQCYKQPKPIFNPTQSSSFSKLSCSSNLCEALPKPNCTNNGCEYIYIYGSAQTQGVMASETFTFGQVPVPNIGFGCGNITQGIHEGAGLVGLGRGPLSLVSQLGQGKFSYCLTSFDDNKTSSLLFGSRASSVNTNGVQVTTPIIQNPYRPSLYYLSLDGITVGSTLLPIQKSTFAIKEEDGSGGVIIDSGTTNTQLEDTALELVMKAFMEQINLPVAYVNSIRHGLLCFSLPSNTSDINNVPKLIFHFDGADLDLPRDNYMISDPNTGLICLAMQGASLGGMSIIGNIQQQNILVLHDLDKQTISFTPTKCDQL